METGSLTATERKSYSRSRKNRPRSASMRSLNRLRECFPTGIAQPLDKARRKRSRGASSAIA